MRSFSLFLCLLVIPLLCYGEEPKKSLETQPEIKLPQIEINIQDNKEIKADLTDNNEILFDVEIDPLIRPEMTEAIKIDLEKTLPERIHMPNKKKPIDALIRFGYGPNNNMMADFSIFIKEFNPMIAINYSRRAKDNYWIDEPKRRNFYSMDNLNADVTYNKSFFNVNANLGYYATNYSLQNQSVYDSFGKKILNVDLNPYLKFSNKNDLSFVVHNTFLFTDLNDGETLNTSLKNNFGYFLESDLIYSQIILNENYFNFNIGYDLNYFDSLTSGKLEERGRWLFHKLKIGASYSGIFKDAWFLSGKLDFQALWKGGELNEGVWQDITELKNPFHWYLLPSIGGGYNFKDYFSCYLEGGAKLIHKPERDWFLKNEYALLPEDVVPGYHFFGKTGIKGIFSGYFSGYTEFEFAYNWGGYDWKENNSLEKLFTVEKKDYFELKLKMGLTAAYRQIVKFNVEWEHSFLEKIAFDAGDIVKTKLDLGVPNTGLTFFIQFSGQFRRVDDRNSPMAPLYLLDAGIDWSYIERFGLGAEFQNILYFQKHQIKRHYDEPGFECLVYMKIGF